MQPGQANVQVEPCPLCRNAATVLLAAYRNRDYRHCPGCDLVFVPAAQHLAPADELRRYQQHRNSPADRAYRDFLDRLLRELIPCLPAGARGLDYGSGPGPTIPVMLRERGFPTAVYDPFFAPAPAVLEQSYDFITCSETVEHFARPGIEFERFDRLLRAGGCLGIMTAIRDPAASFADWWYIRDETHVAFYSQATLRWIGGSFGWRIYLPAPTIAIFKKPEPTPKPPAAQREVVS